MLNCMADGMIAKYGSREEALKVATERSKAASFGDLRYWDGIVNELSKPQSSNYVLFRDDIIDILRKYGIPGAGVAGAGALAAGADPAQAAPVRPEDIAKALREGK